MVKRFARLKYLVFALLLAACQGGAEPAGPDQTAAPTKILTTDTQAVATPTEAPLPTEPLLATRPPTAVPLTAATDVTATTEAQDNDPTATPTQSVQVNGRHPDGTYFRGRSDAPIVMIDYSDFF